MITCGWRHSILLSPKNNIVPECLKAAQLNYHNKPLHCCSIVCGATCLEYHRSCEAYSSRIMQSKERHIISNTRLMLEDFWRKFTFLETGWNTTCTFYRSSIKASVSPQNCVKSYKIVVNCRLISNFCFLLESYHKRAMKISFTVDTYLVFCVLLESYHLRLRGKAHPPPFIAQSKSNVKPARRFSQQTNKNIFVIIDENHSDQLMIPIVSSTHNC